MAINWNEIYNNLFSGPLPGNQVTPDSDNVDFDHFPGANKAKMMGGNDFADGNDGANVIFGNGGRDYLRGDGGDDTLHGGGGNDAIIGDSLEGPGLNGGLTAGNDLLWGGSGNDVIAGQNGNDDIDGGNGRDLLIGGNGNDTMNGGMGNDFVIGGNGNDNMRGGWNNDKLAGQLGNDVMRGGTGDDLMSGGDGEDSMYGGSHNDTMSGNAGHDYMNGGNGHDVMYGNSGHDNMRGWNGNDSMRGDCGDDAIAGERGDDLLLGDKGNDYITGGAGDDLIDGGKHNDIIEGNDNADCIKGGEGNDLIYGDNANPADPAEGEASDLISGGEGNDTIYGNEDDDQIDGDEGRDLIFGGTGNDVISGGDDADTIDGGVGKDQISGDRGNDSIDGNSGNDTISGGRGNDTVNGGNGNDHITGNSGRDNLNGDNGMDIIDGGRDADTIDGGRGNDLLYGGDDGGAGDLIRGDSGQSGGGNDTLIGGDGNDTLEGGKGDDCLISGRGNETLTGGGDSDIFYFGYARGYQDEEKTARDIGPSPVHGNDIITDFSMLNDDLIQLHSDLSIEHVSLDGNDMIIDTSGGSIRVVNAVLVVSGLNPDDVDFNGSSEALEKFITDYNPVNGEGKGFVFFGDKNVDFKVDTPDAAETGWKARFPDEVKMNWALSDQKIGDTTKNTTEQIMAERFLKGDVNVHLNDDGTQIIFDPDASTPPTVEVTASDEVIEDIDASAQLISQDGIVSFDDIDSTDTVTITYEVKEAPVWSDGDFANVALNPQDLIDAFFTGVEDAKKPGTTPWTWEGTFDLDFLAKDETIKFTIDVIATDCDDASSRVPLEFTITGTNDVPTIDAEESVVFTEAGDASNQLLEHISSFDHDDLDYNDELTVLVESNNDIVWSADGALDAGLAARLEAGAGLDGAGAGPIPTPGTTDWRYGLIDNVIEDLDFLGEGETIKWSYTFSVTDPHGAMDSDIVDFTIEGTNDRPVAANLFYQLSEDDSSAAVDSGEGNVLPFAALVGTAPTFNFAVTDDDVNDTHTFEIVGLTEIAPGVYQTVDEFGNEYGKLTNNGDGTFTFDPEDDFQHLTAEESREVTFQYQARDDSGAGETPTPPSESELSAVKTVTLTVNGSDDVNLVHTDDLEFATNNQSQFGTGEAIIFEPDLPFLGFDTGNVSLDATIFGGLNLSGDVLEGILEGIEAVAQVFADIGCEIGSWFGADCDADVDLPSSINIPGISSEGSFAAKVGLQPYFSFNSGEVDADIPVEVVFTAPRQVEHGDTFNVQSAFTVDGGASFQTMSPNVNFGIDFVLDIAADLALRVGSSLFNLFDVDTGDIDGFEGTQGEPGFNIFDLSGEDLEISEIDLFGLGTLDLNFPVINTDGSPVNPPANTVLESTGEDDIAVLTADLDAIAAQLIEVATGVPITFGESGSEGLSIDVAGESLNLLSFDWSWDLISVNLINTLKVIQDFTLTVEDLPLMAMLEDGSSIDGIGVGDNIEVVLGPDSAFDVDVDGDADGMLDFEIAIDMDAVFENLTTLGLDMDLFVGLLSLTGGISSDFFDGPSISLFDGIIPSVDGNNDTFLYGDTFSLLSDVELATLYEDEFAIEGWNTDQDTTFDVDVA